MSLYQKKLKNKMDDEIKLAGLEALVPEELDKNLILNSNRLRTFEGLEVVTHVEAKFGLRIRDPKRVTRVCVDTQIPWMLMRSILSRLAREKGHRVRVMGVSISVEHIFNETAMQARTPASNRLAKADRASHGPRVRTMARVRRTRENPKENPKEPKVPKDRTRAKHRKLVSQVLKTRNQRQARTLRNLHRRVPLTLPGTMVGIVTNGTMAGVLLDGTKVGNKRMTLPQAHFHFEFWISVPRVVRSGLNG